MRPRSVIDGETKKLPTSVPVVDRLGPDAITAEIDAATHHPLLSWN
jgi:hypothetical protein